jgi:hypothetical protein
MGLRIMVILKGNNEAVELSKALSWKECRRGRGDNLGFLTVNEGLRMFSHFRLTSAHSLTKKRESMHAINFGPDLLSTMLS